MQILVIGGRIFLGAAVVESALARGHAIIVFNRGRARSAWPAGVEVVVGDRSADLGRLAGRRFDAVELVGR
jgi:2'-hydroxyisoflavone reductase